MINLSSRTFLQQLRSAAFGAAAPNLTLEWVRAYEDLALAADRLDALLARLGVCEFNDVAAKFVEGTVVSPKQGELAGVSWGPIGDCLHYRPYQPTVTDSSGRGTVCSPTTVTPHENSGI